jgi:hypothetical protein
MCLSAHQQRDENRPQLTQIFRNSPFATRYFLRGQSSKMPQPPQGSSSDPKSPRSTPTVGW